MSTKEIGETNPVEQKLGILKLSAIAKTLREKILPIKGTGLTLEINQLLVTMYAYIEMQQKIIKGIDDVFTFKDDNQEPILYAYHQSGELAGKFKLDANGDYITVSKENASKIPCTTRIDSLNPDYIKEVKKFEDSYHYVINKLDKKKVKSLCNSDKLDGIDYTILIGTVFEL